MSPEDSSSTEDDHTKELTVASHRVKPVIDPLAPPTKFQLWFYAVIASVIMGLTRLWFGARLEGAEHVPASGPFILAPVHRSNVDFALVVRIAGRRRMRYLAKDTLWKGPLGRIWSALGAIPVHRGSADREALTACIGVLEQGEPLVMFPEGTRQSGPAVTELFDGVAYVQAKTGVIVLPVGIGGSEQAMPKGARFPRRKKVVVRIGAPLAPLPLTPTGRVPRNAVRDRTAELKTVLQRLFDDTRRAAGTE